MLILLVGLLGIPKLTFDDVVAVHSPLSSYATRKDWIVYFQRKEKGKEKLINEVGSCSSSLLGCEGANEGVDFSLGKAVVHCSNGPPYPHCEQVEVVGESSLSVLECIIYFCKRMGVGIEGREMELLSFLASLESISHKDNQFVDERGRDQEGRRSSFDGDMSQSYFLNITVLNCPIKGGDIKWVLHGFACDIAIL